MKAEDIWKNQDVPVSSQREADKNLLASLEHHHGVLKNTLNRLATKYLNLGVMFKELTNRQDIFAKKFDTDILWFVANKTGRALADRLEKLHNIRKNLRYRISTLRDRLDKKKW